MTGVTRFSGSPAEWLDWVVMGATLKRSLGVSAGAGGTHAQSARGGLGVAPDLSRRWPGIMVTPSMTSLLATVRSAR